MRIAIASGKGGTGKTFVTVNLARSLGMPVTVLDCDVEEPNSNLFLHGDLVSQSRVSVCVPHVLEDACTGCRVCADACQFNAIAVIGRKPLVFEDMCHSCGVCTTLCPHDALIEVPHEIGTVTVRQSQHVSLVEGLLDVGKALAVPVIRQVKGQVGADTDHPVLIDAPPGTSCPMVWAVDGCDAVVLVAEPTAFSLHDLSLAIDTVREVGVSFGVVINKDGLGDDRVARYCESEGIPILGRIPFDLDIARRYATGALIVDKEPRYRDLFLQMWQSITHLAQVGGNRDESLA